MNPSADRDLLQALLDGMLPAEEEQAVEERLRVEPNLAALLIELSRDEAIFSEWARTQRVLAEQEPPILRPARPYLRRLAIGLTAAAAAGLAFVFLRGFESPQQTPEDTTSMARVEEMQGEVFVVPESGEAFLAERGQPLAPGQGLRTGGDGSFAVVKYAESRFELGSETAIRFDPTRPTKLGSTGKKIVLEHGSVAADVTRQPENRPMILSTPHAEARLEETRSTFLSASDGTRIEQEKGRLKVTRTSDGQSIEVPNGSYAVASPKGAQLQFQSRPMPTRVTEPRLTLTEASGPILCAAFSPDGSVLAVGCSDGTVKLWNVETGQNPQIIKAHRKPVRALAFSPQGNLIATSSADERVIRLWNPATGSEVATLKGLKGIVESLAFSPDGALLASGGGYGKITPEIHLWDVTNRSDLVTLGEHTHHVTSVAFSPDGQTLATGGKDLQIHLWDLDLMEVRATLRGHTERVNAVAFAPSGLQLATGSRDRTVKVWDVASGMEQRTLPGQAGEIRSVAFSPDGRILAAADTTVTLWDMPTARPRLTLRGAKTAIAAVVYSPCNKVIATVGYDRMIRIWDVPGE